MKKDIESLLRESKLQVKENPTFLLEVQQKMRAVDGIKAEVDRQRRSGRHSLVIALFFGLAFGLLVAALAYLYPINPESIEKDILTSIKSLIDPWKHYILFFVAVCAIVLGIIYSTKKENLIDL